MAARNSVSSFFSSEYWSPSGVAAVAGKGRATGVMTGRADVYSYSLRHEDNNYNECLDRTGNTHSQRIDVEVNVPLVCVPISLRRRRAFPSFRGVVRPARFGQRLVDINGSPRIELQIPVEDDR